MEEQEKGNYFGTEKDGAWFKRFRQDGFFARGNGRFWLGEEGLFFLRKLTKIPLEIRWDEMTDVHLGKWHAGKWAAGRPVLKVDFRRHGLNLCAGFFLSESWPEMETFASDLSRKIEAVS